MEKRSKFASWLSGAYLLVSILLLLWVCGICYPQVRHLVIGEENSPVRQAFGILAEGLEAGEPVRETVAESLQILIGRES